MATAATLSDSRALDPVTAGPGLSLRSLKYQTYIRDIVRATATHPKHADHRMNPRPTEL